MGPKPTAGVLRRGGESGEMHLEETRQEAGHGVGGLGETGRAWRGASTSLGTPRTVGATKSQAEAWKGPP